MDENETNPDKKSEEVPSADNGSAEPAKRFKFNETLLTGSEESSSSSSNANQENASTSSGAGDAAAVSFHLSPNTRNRNYRNSQTNAEDSAEERDDPMGDEQPPPPAEEGQITDENEEEEENDNDWEDYEEDDDEYVNSMSGNESNPFGDSSDDSTIIDHDEPDISEYPLFKKEPPKHWWFALNEVNKRQLGFSSKLQSRELFQRRCYGSLHCVKRLELMYKLEEHAGCVNSLNFHPDGSLLASGSDDLKVVIWDWKIGKCLLKYKTKHRGNVFQSKFLHLSGDLHVVSCARDGQVRLAQLSKEDGIRSTRLLGTHKGPCHKLIVLSEQPHVVLSAGEDGVVLNHDVRGPKSTKVVTVKYNSRTIPLYSLHGHPLNSNEFCVSGRDSYVRVYDQRKCNTPTSSYTPFSRNVKDYHVTCAVYNHDGSEILATYSDSDIYLFDVNDPKCGNYIHQYQGHRNGATIKGVNFFGPKSEFVVSGSDCGNIYFWERNSEALVQWFPGDDSGVVNCLEPHPQLPFICTSGLDWDVKVWVPSCEEEPKMDGLKTTVKSNLKKKLARTDGLEINESQMLWMLWRHLRDNNRLRASNLLNVRNFLYPSDSNSSGSGSEAHSEGSDEDLDGVPSCNTS